MVESLIFIAIGEYPEELTSSTLSPSMSFRISEAKQLLPSGTLRVLAPETPFLQAGKILSELSDRIVIDPNLSFTDVHLSQVKESFPEFAEKIGPLNHETERQVRVSTTLVSYRGNASICFAAATPIIDVIAKAMKFTTEITPGIWKFSSGSLENVVDFRLALKVETATKRLGVSSGNWTDPRDYQVTSGLHEMKKQTDYISQTIDKLLIKEDILVMMEQSLEDMFNTISLSSKEIENSYLQKQENAHIPSNSITIEGIEYKQAENYSVELINLSDRDISDFEIRSTEQLIFGNHHILKAQSKKLVPFNIPLAHLLNKRIIHLAVYCESELVSNEFEFRICEIFQVEQVGDKLSFKIRNNTANSLNVSIVFKTQELKIYKDKVQIHSQSVLNRSVAMDKIPQAELIEVQYGGELASNRVSIPS